jgi:hypothetical protein
LRDSETGQSDCLVDLGIIVGALNPELEVVEGGVEALAGLSLEERAAATSLRTTASAGAAEGAAETLLSDGTLVCRGGSCTAERFANGSGVVSDSAGNISGVSVNAGEGSLQELTATLRYKQVGVSTVGEIRAAGGMLTPKPSTFNSFHHELSGLSAETLEQLFTPTVRNPNL